MADHHRCAHDRVRQLLSIVGDVEWCRKPDGSYDKGTMSAVTEETVEFQCVDCGEYVWIRDGHLDI